MFQNLSDKLQSAFKNIRGKTAITEKELDITLREVRLALLEADVNYKVTKEFCNKIKESAQGSEVQKSLQPDQQIIKIVHEELKAVLGSETVELDLKASPPVVIMMAGLQGAGKTTTCGKLAIYLRKTLKRKPLLVPADVYRPAAIEQLKTLGKQIDIPVFNSNEQQKPVDIATQAIEEAKLKGQDVIILDTAGRLQIDEELMGELKELETTIKPQEILLVADAMTGQEAVNMAEGFANQLDITGLVLTKLDGDARGGAALSMRTVTGKPIKFIGLGEKLDALEVYHPDRLASRILGMGDMLSLIEKASAEIDIDESQQMVKKFQKNQFDFNDFLGQLRMMNKMGSIGSIMKMVPGMNKMAGQIDEQKAEKDLKRTESIILSMTKLERTQPEKIDGSRRKRIAKGSGTQVQDVNQLMKQFMQMKKMMKQMNKMGMGNMMKAMGGGGGNMMKMLKKM